MSFIMALFLGAILFTIYVHDKVKSNEFDARVKSEQAIRDQFRKQFEDPEYGRRIDAMLYDRTKRDEITKEVEEVFSQIPQLSDVANDWYVTRPGYCICNRTLVGIILRANRGKIGWFEHAGYSCSIGYAYVDHEYGTAVTMPLKVSTLNRFCEIISEKMIAHGSECKLIYTGNPSTPFRWVPNR